MGNIICNNLLNNLFFNNENKYILYYDLLDKDLLDYDLLDNDLLDNDLLDNDLLDKNIHSYNECFPYGIDILNV